MKRRRLWRSLRQIERNHRPEAQLTEEELRHRAAEYFAERRPIDYRLWELETIELRRCAAKLSIDIPTEYDESGFSVGHYFFSPEDRNALKRAIRVEKRESARFWMGIIVPVLSLLVALAALLR